MTLQLLLASCGIGFATSTVVHHRDDAVSLGMAESSSREWAACREAEARDRNFWVAQWHAQESELLQLQAAARALVQAHPPNTTAPMPRNATGAMAHLNQTAGPSKKHQPSPLAGLKLNLNPKSPADLLPALAMLKGLYDDGKDRIMDLNAREKESKQHFSEEEAQHNATIVKLDQKVKDGKLPAAFAANETRDENRIWNYWQRVRERQRHQFHTMLKIQHATMGKAKTMIDMYEKTIAGTADRSRMKDELSKVAGAAAAPEVVLMQQAVGQDIKAYCIAALEEVRMAQSELRAGSTTQTQFVCGQQTTIALSTSANAAGAAEFFDVLTTDGKCNRPANDKVTAVKFCGPGKLILSRMTCSEHHAYKAMVVEHSSSSYTTNCETISSTGTVVDGWLGSFTLSCR